MDNVVSVEMLDAKRSRWVVKAPGDKTVEWTSMITEEIDGEVISWAIDMAKAPEEQEPHHRRNQCAHDMNAHLFYLKGDDGEDHGELDFPGTEEPEYWDFVYFAFTLGMTFQTSDTAIRSTRLRKVGDRSPSNVTLLSMTRLPLTGPEAPKATWVNSDGSNLTPIRLASS